MGRTVLTEELAAHLVEDPSLYLASTSSDREPQLARAVMAIPLDAVDAIDVFFAPAAGATLMDSIEAGRRAAIVAARVQDYRTFQYKGTIARVVPATPDELVRIDAAIARFGTIVEHVGIDATRYCATLSTPPYVRVRLEVDAVFDQTPRVGAGARVRGTTRGEQGGAQ